MDIKWIRERTPVKVRVRETRTKPERVAQEVTADNDPGWRRPERTVPRRWRQKG